MARGPARLSRTNRVSMTTRPPIARRAWCHGVERPRPHGLVCDCFLPIAYSTRLDKYRQCG